MVAQSVPLFPAGVLVVPVAGVVRVGASPVVVTAPALGIGTQRAHIDKDRSHSRERTDVTIGGD